MGTSPPGMFAVGNEQYPIIKIPPLWFLQWRRQTAGSCDSFPRWESITAVTVGMKTCVCVCVLINWSHSALTGPGLAQDRFLYSVKLEARFCCSLEDICPSFLWRTFSFTVFFSGSCFFCYIVTLIFIPDFFFSDWILFIVFFFSSWIPLGIQRFHQQFGGTLIQGCVFPSVMRPWEDYSLSSASVA